MDADDERNANRVGHRHRYGDAAAYLTHAYRLSVQQPWRWLGLTARDAGVAAYRPPATAHGHPPPIANVHPATRPNLHPHQWTNINAFGHGHPGADGHSTSDLPDR